jgi:uncharacterized alkaline shock family protein YloU
VTAIWNNPAAPNGPAHTVTSVGPNAPQQGDVQNQGPQPPAAEAPQAEQSEQSEQPEVEATAEQPDQAEQPEQTEQVETSEAEVEQPEEERVQGQIEIADEVVEKVAALAALEVEGVADLGGDVARLLESVRERIGVGQKRGDQGVKATITGDEVAINLTIVVEYGHVVMDVARNVQTNVAEVAEKMLGLRIAAVNVKVDDVQLPQAASVGRRRDDASASGEGAAE